MNGPKLIGRYEIVAEIGRGAMGSVFKARDPAVGRIVALKTVHAAALAGNQSDEFRARFYREARASGVLAHPGIVPVFDVGEHEGAPFLVMEFVDGRTLDAAMKKGERFTIDRVCELGQQMGDALGYAHRQGVIHRDVKPANILMTSREVYGSERPRITDFGIAKLTSVDITTTGQLLGTPSFMAPEQFTGSPVDGRIDIFSLGVILYSLATGEQPFAGETMTAISYKVAHVDPIPPAKLNPAVSAGLEAVILKALVKNPAERYQTCEALAQDLAAIRAGAPPSALHAVAPPAVDTDATLGPGQSTPPSLGSRPSAALASATPASNSVGPRPAEAPNGRKPGKPAQVETLFAVILLAIAGLGTAAAGAWFVFTHVLSFAHHQHQVALAAPPPPTSPAAPTVQIPQPETTTPTGDQTPTTATPSATNTATAPATPQSVATNAPPSNPATKQSASGAAKPSPSKSKPPSQQASGPAQSAPAANSAAAKSTPAPPTPSPSPATPAPAANATEAKTAPAAFDPRKLDPNTSTKLKIEPSKLPSGLAIHIELDRKPYLAFTTGDKTDLDNLFIPAGVHELRVQIKSGDQEFESNIVSDSFKAKKKKTLKIEVQQNGRTPSKIPVPLTKDMTVFVSFPLLPFDF